jgi:hypothetical protein
MPVWQYAQLTIAACSRSQDNKCSRAPCEVVSVPDRQPADLVPPGNSIVSLTCLFACDAGAVMAG